MSSSNNKSAAASKLRSNILKDLEDSIELETSDSILIGDGATSVLRSAVLLSTDSSADLSDDEPVVPKVEAPPQADDDKTALLNIAEQSSDNSDYEPASEHPISYEPKASYDRSSNFEVPHAEVVPFKPANKLEERLFESQNLKIAQDRIEELERDLENLRKENQTLVSVSQAANEKADDLISRVHQLERAKSELKEQNESELEIFRQGMLSKDTEISKLKTKISELESQVSSDLRKIRVRERELENRLELVKAEKNALLKSKDESILDLKRKLDLQQEELYSAKSRVIELQARLDSDQEKFARTVRALRIALTNLEVEENTSSITIAPLKKAE